jgi:hypothetical protein
MDTPLGVAECLQKIKLNDCSLTREFSICDGAEPLLLLLGFVDLGSGFDGAEQTVRLIEGSRGEIQNVGSSGLVGRR